MSIGKLAHLKLRGKLKLFDDCVQWGPGRGVLNPASRREKKPYPASRAENMAYPASRQEFFSYIFY